MIIKNIKPFIGQHCETTTTGTLLNQIGIELSEPMLFGIGEGLGFMIWKMKSFEFPFIGGRIKTDLITENICRNLNLHLEVKETSSIKKAWENIANPISKGQAVGVKLDCFHLEYFTKKIHFAGHYAAMYGFDERFAYLIDTNQQGGQVKTKLKNLELARNEKGPMSSKNKSFTISKLEDTFNINSTIKNAILNNAAQFLNPPIRNFGYKGIKKSSSEIEKWFHNSQNIKSEFQTSAMLMERAGTGGALFRNLYRDFLQESAERLKNTEIKKGYNSYKKIASLWTEISKLFMEIGEYRNEKHLKIASNIFKELSFLEKDTMEKLRKACA